MNKNLTIKSTEVTKELARFFMSDEENIRKNVTGLALREESHTSTAPRRVENEHQLIIFGATLMVIAAVVFIAKNRETAKRKRRRANKYAKEMKYQKRYLSKRLSTTYSGDDSRLHPHHTSIDSGKSVIIIDFTRKPERKTRTVSTKLGKLGKDKSLPSV